MENRTEKITEKKRKKTVTVLFTYGIRSEPYSTRTEFYRTRTEPYRI